jgi:uncharacterized protein
MSEASISVPVSTDKRHMSLDAMRGFALLGILSINIAGFGLAGFGIMFPEVSGGTDGANATSWIITNMFAEGSMRTLFSMMFGAGVVLLTARMFEKGQGETCADIYYRRTIWLIALGLVDGYLFLWWGDILFLYGIVGLFLYPLRNVSPKKLIRTSAVLILLFSLPGIGLMFQGEKLVADAKMAEVVLAEGGELTREQRGAYNGLKLLLDMSSPTAEELESQVEAMQGSYFDSYAVTSKITSKFQWEEGPSFMIDILMMMLLGMAFLKNGVFTNMCKTRTYVLFVVFGYGLGFAMRAFTTMKGLEHNFALEGIIYGFSVAHPSRLALAIGHIGLIMLLIRSGFFGWLITSLAAVGRMALTNYLMQSIICAFIFYGFGLGLYGTVERYELYPIMAGIWVFQIVFSLLWLKTFRFGPFEWVWRSLTYNKRQKMLL